MRTAPDGFTLLFSHDGFNIHYFWNQLKLEVIGFSGRRKKADFFYRYKEEDHLKARASDLFARKVRELQEVQDRKTAPTCLKVNDILRSSWGHEQTNIDAYLVVALLGRRKVSIQAIGTTKTYTEGWNDRGYCLPDPAVKIGKPFTKIADRDGYIQFESFRSASPWPKIDDANLMPAAWSSYA